VADPGIKSGHHPPSCLTIDFGLPLRQRSTSEWSKDQGLCFVPAGFDVPCIGMQSLLTQGPICSKLAPPLQSTSDTLLTYFCMRAFVKRRHYFFLQDLNETSVSNATGFPDLTKCFQVTVLVWIPCGYLLTVAPFYIWSLVTSLRSYIRHTWLNVTKTVIDPFVWRCILLNIALFSIIIYALPFINYHLYISIYTLAFIHYHLYVTVHMLPFIHYHLYVTIYTLPFIHYRLYITVYILLFIHYHLYVAVYTLPFIHYHSLII